MSEGHAIPPRNGEGDQPKAGGGVGATSRATVLRARRERSSGNPPEVILWRALRQKPGGLKFRRQHPIGPYCLDFACIAARLAIEVDGEVHSRGDRPARDQERDAAVELLGLTTLRVSATDVLRDTEAVVTMIVQACRGRLPLHHRPLADGPPPRSGEVEATS